VTTTGTATETDSTTTTTDVTSTANAPTTTATSTDVETTTATATTTNTATETDHTTTTTDTTTITKAPTTTATSTNFETTTTFLTTRETVTYTRDQFTKGTTTHGAATYTCPPVPLCTPGATAGIKLMVYGSNTNLDCTFGTDFSVENNVINGIKYVGDTISTGRTYSINSNQYLIDPTYGAAEASSQSGTGIHIDFVPDHDGTIPMLCEIQTAGQLVCRSSQDAHYSTFSFVDFSAQDMDSTLTHVLALGDEPEMQIGALYGYPVFIKAVCPLV